MVRLFQKPKIDDKAQLAKLQTDIFEATTKLEGIDKEYLSKYQLLETEFSIKKTAKQKEVDELENKLGIMRGERIELEKPIEHKRQALVERENSILLREKSTSETEQTALIRERDAEQKLEDVKELSDQLGETRVRLTVREKLLKGREDTLKDRENAHLVKIDKFSHEVNEAAALIQEKENAVLLKETNVQGKEENLIKREQELLAGHVLLNDRRILVEKGWAELREKQHKSK